MASTVRELTSAIASGNSEALSRFYRDWFDFMLHEARRCTGGNRDEHFCLDAVQETMMRVIKRLKPLDSEATLCAWLRTAVRSSCMDLLRKEIRLRKRERRQATERRDAMHDGAAQDSPETLETLAWLREELSRVDPVTASALDMRYRMNFTLARIGQALHLRTGAVDGRINRTVAQMRAAASAQEDSHD